MNAEQEKKLKNKSRFLEELKEAFSEIREAEEHSKDTGLKYVDAFEIVKKNGGKRPGAGAPKKANVATNRSVRLTDTDYRKIVKKYGSFARGVKALLQD